VHNYRKTLRLISHNITFYYSNIYNLTSKIVRYEKHTVSTGIENPTPEDAPDGEYIAVFIPIKLPELSSSGPPLLPGLIAASVCITSCIGRPVAAELISLRNPLKKTKI